MLSHIAFLVFFLFACTALNLVSGALSFCSGALFLRDVFRMFNGEMEMPGLTTDNGEAVTRYICGDGESKLGCHVSIIFQVIFACEFFAVSLVLIWTLVPHNIFQLFHYKIPSERVTSTKRFKVNDDAFRLPARRALDTLWSTIRFGTAAIGFSNIARTISFLVHCYTNTTQCE